MAEWAITAWRTEDRCGASSECSTQERHMAAQLPGHHAGISPFPIGDLVGVYALRRWLAQIGAIPFKERIIAGEDLLAPAVENTQLKVGCTVADDNAEEFVVPITIGCERIGDVDIR